MATIFVPLVEEMTEWGVLDAALRVAGPGVGHIRAVFVGSDGEMPSASGAGDRAASAARQARFDEWRARNRVPGPSGDRRDGGFATWSVADGDIEAVVARLARVSDITVVPRLTPQSPLVHRCFDAALFGGGHPVLVVPETPPADLTDHIMIAWNGSLEASRAVMGTMPLLHRAGRVSIFSAPEPDGDTLAPADLAEFLASHGIDSETVERPRDKLRIGAALVDAAVRRKATLIVMGGYTHSRVREGFFGGATRHLLVYGLLPLLMSH